MVGIHMASSSRGMQATPSPLATHGPRSAGSRLRYRHSSCRSPRRSGLALRAGLFDFLPASQPKSTPESSRLVDQLIELTLPTGSGAKASKELREEIDGLAEQLKRFRIRNPTKSSLFWGQFEALYCSLPVATGGPFIRGPIGQALLWGQEIRQNLIEPATYLNRIKFKGLGLLPGEAKQLGTITSSAGNGFEVMLEAPTLKLGDGQEKPQQSKSYPTQRKFEVLYLDEQIKIIRYLPDEADKERVLFVQRRVPEEVPEVDMPAVAEEDADLEDQEQIAEAVPA